MVRWTTTVGDNKQEIQTNNQPWAAAVQLSMSTLETQSFDSHQCCSWVSGSTRGSPVCVCVMLTLIFLFNMNFMTWISPKQSTLRLHWLCKVQSWFKTVDGVLSHFNPWNADFYKFGVSVNINISIDSSITVQSYNFVCSSKSTFTVPLQAVVIFILGLWIYHFIKFLYFFKREWCHDYLPKETVMTFTWEERICALSPVKLTVNFCMLHELISFHGHVFHVHGK